MKVRIIAAFGICLSLASCASTSPTSIPAQEREQLLKEIVAGDLVMYKPTIAGLGGYSRAARAGATQRELQQLYGMRQWADLAVMIALVELGDNLRYYYLGRAVEELGHLDAALVYYHRAVEESGRALTGRCISCDGFDFPADIEARIETVNKKKAEAQYE